MKRKLSLLVLVFLSLTLFAQRYEGERNSKGLAHGQGTMYFDNVDNGLSTEKLEGKFKKGVPVSGKSYRYNKSDGRPKMRFSGNFKLKKDVYNNLSDLFAYGDIVFFFFEKNGYYNDYGYRAAWGKYDGNKIQSGFWLSYKYKQIGRITNGNWGNLDNNAGLTAEARNYYDEITQILDKEHRKIEKELRKRAENGDINAQKELGIKLWTGENITQNKKEAVKWLKAVVDKFKPSTTDQMEVHDYLIVAKGEGYYDEPIPYDWYGGWRTPFIQNAAKNGNKEAELAMALNDRHKAFDVTYFKNKIESGDRKAAELLDMKLKGYYNENDILLLLNNSSKTGYDKYMEDVKLIEEIYQDAIAFVKAGNEEGFKDKNGFAKIFVEFYSKHPQYDKQGVLKKANLLVRFCLVSNALNLRDDPNLWSYKDKGFLGLTRTPEWDTKTYNYIFGKLNDAIAACRNLSSDPALGSFFKQSLPKLNAKLAKTTAYSDAERKKYLETRQKFNEEQRIKKERYEEWLCDGCKIDGEKTSFPKGYVEGFRSLFLTYPAESKEKGKIVLKNGCSIEWKWVYDTHPYIKAKGSLWYGSREFDSVEIMIDTIIQNCKEKYCK